MARTSLITGVLGQDGRLLARLLASRGERVVGMARAGSQPPAHGDWVADHLVTGVDLTDSASVRAVLHEWQPDAVYHLAAFHHAAQDSSVSAAIEAKEKMVATNFLSTKTLALALAEMRSACHLVYAASSQMYTAQNAIERIDEATPRRPSTFYGYTKAWSVDLLAFLRNESGLRASSAILFNHESPRRGVQFVSRKITQAAAKAAAGIDSSLELFNTATRVDWSSAQDVAQAMALIAASDAPRDYVVASGVLHSVRAMLELAFGHVGLDWQRYARIREDREAPALLGCPNALEAQLAWKRTIGFGDMVRQMVDHDIAAQRAQLG